MVFIGIFCGEVGGERPEFEPRSLRFWLDSQQHGSSYRQRSGAGSGRGSKQGNNLVLNLTMTHIALRLRRNPMIGCARSTTRLRQPLL